MQGAVEAIVFSTLYAGVGELLVEDNAILVQGRLQRDEQSIKVIADTIIPMNKAEETWTASIHFHVDMSRTDREALVRLQEKLLQHPGSCRAFLHLRDPQGTDTVIGLPDRIKLRAGSLLTREVNRLLGYNAVETVCSVAAAAPNAGPNRNGYKGYKSNGRY
jgi:DNA polymerase-3 subunit alpha